MPSVTTIAHRFLAGHGWDETFDEAAILEDIGRLANKVGLELNADDRATVLELWREERTLRGMGRWKAPELSTQVAPPEKEAA